MQSWPQQLGFNYQAQRRSGTERNPGADPGSPGPLVDFIEESNDYVPALEASLAVAPLHHTVHMVNRIANGLSGRTDIERWIQTLDQAQRHPSADSPCRETAAGLRSTSASGLRPDHAPKPAARWEVSRAIMRRAPRCRMTRASGRTG